MVLSLYSDVLFYGTACNKCGHPSSWALCRSIEDTPTGHRGHSHQFCVECGWNMQECCIANLERLAEPAKPRIVKLDEQESRRGGNLYLVMRYWERREGKSSEKYKRSLAELDTYEVGLANKYGYSAAKAAVDYSLNQVVVRE